MVSNMNTKSFNSSSLPQSQQGAALVVGLIVLLIMTMLGVASMGSMTTQLRMSANVQVKNTAFQAGTAAIDAAKSSAAIAWLVPAGYVVGGPPIAIATQPALYTATNAEAQATILYSGCKRVVYGKSLTAGGGASVHEIRVTGNALGSSSDVIGSTSQVLGLITTIVSSC